MKKLVTNPQLLALALVGVAVISRWLPHPANVAPITAVALFSGVYLNKKTAIVLPLLSMLLSDLIIGFYGPMMVFVYGSFLLSSLIGFIVRKSPSKKKIIAASLCSSVLFFLITNFGVWFAGTMYSKDVSGLLTSYVAGLPFFRNTLLGDLFYTTVLFGAYRLMDSSQSAQSRRLNEGQVSTSVN